MDKNKFNEIEFQINIINNFVSNLKNELYDLNVDLYKKNNNNIQWLILNNQIYKLLISLRIYIQIILIILLLIIWILLFKL
jgi:hypothetical protein